MGQTYNVSTLAGGTWLDGPALESKFYSPSGTAVDRAGNIYVADRDNNRIRKISPAGVVTTIAGGGSTRFDSYRNSIGTYLDGTGIAARFDNPTDLAVDSVGNIFVADYGNNRIRKISPEGVVTTLAGSGLAGYIDGTDTSARFNGPSGIALDPIGNIYVADKINNRIRKINPSGVVTTFAGSGGIGFLNAGFADGVGNVARFNQPTGLAVDVAGIVYVADLGNNRIRKINLAGMVSTLAGSGTYDYVDGIGTNARFSFPSNIAVDSAGNVYVADQENLRIRKISPSGEVITLAGSGNFDFNNGIGTAASFNRPSDVTVDRIGNIIVSDRDNHKIRKISPAGVVSTIAGSNFYFDDDTGTAASFSEQEGIAIDRLGNVIVADKGNHRIRKISPAGAVTTLAGSGTMNFAEGTGTAASFAQPSGVAVDIDHNVYVADLLNHRIRKISPAGLVTTLAGSGPTGYFGGGYADGIGTDARFLIPPALAVDRAGNVYVADEANNRIRKISAEGVVSTLAGSGTEGYADGAGTSARFNEPIALTVDSAGNVYVADRFNHRIRKISPAGVVTTFAGSGAIGYSGGGFEDGIATTAKFFYPCGVTVDRSGNLYVIDLNSKIRKISPDGLVSTIAGSEQGFADGSGTEARFNQPTGIAVDLIGNIYVSDGLYNGIRKISPCNALVLPTISGGNNFCAGSSITLTSSSVTGNLWSNGATTQSITVNTAGSYTVRAVSGVCNSNFSDTFRVVVNLPTTSLMSQSICQGSAYQFGGSIRTTIGLYHDTLANSLGCDSIVTLALTVRPVSSSSLTQSICQGSSYRFGGLPRTTSGTYYDTLTNSLGCDSIITLNLTVRPVSSSSLTQSICQCNTYLFGSLIRTVSGVYYDTLANSVGCDSVVTLTLTVISPASPFITGDTAFCQGSFSRLTSSSPTGNLWSTGDTTQFINVAQAGSYSVRVINSGCTSAASTPFRVINQGPAPTVINFDTTSNRCLGARLQLTPAGTFSHYYWNIGERTRSIYTRLSGQYSVQVANSDSCFGLPSPPIFIAFDTNWCTVEIYRFGLDSITANVWADYYIWYLNGIELLSSNTQKTIPIQGDGVYTFRAVIGARTSPLSNPIVITSSKKSINAPKLKLHPNPSSGMVTLTTSPDAESITITNAIGQVVYATKAQAEMELNLNHLANGIYLVQVQSSKGVSTQRLEIQ